MPLVSLVIPSLNQGGYITGALESIWRQEYPNIEILVIDGGSTDSTLSILDRHKNRIDVTVCERDSGTSEAINKGWSLASGELVWVLNSDDELHDASTIRSLVNALHQDTQAVFAYGDMLVVDENDRLIGKRNFQEYSKLDLLTDRRQLPWPGCLLRKSVLSKVGMFNRDLYYSNDLDFYLRIIDFGRFTHLDTVTGMFRIHESSSTQSNVFDSGTESIAVCMKYLETHSAEFTEMEANKILTYNYLFQASVHFHGGDARNVREAIRNCVASEKSMLINVKVIAYWIFSLTGNRGMRLFSKISRIMLKNRLFFEINNKISTS